jgi:hypothetical protein
MNELEDRVAVAFSRTITRSRLFQGAMRWTLGLGTAAATSWSFTGKASASGCGSGGQVGYWGCYCSLGFPGCGSGKCCFDTQNACCGGAVPNCSTWSPLPYCWCSLNCCIGSSKGYYSCCDCWSYGDGDGHCDTGGGATWCICGYRILTGSC